MKNIKTYLLLFLITFSTLSEAQTSKDFTMWLEGLKNRIKNQGISKVTINKYLHSGLKPIEKIIKLDRNQPEYNLSFRTYYRGYATYRAKTQAWDLLNIHKTRLLEIEKKYKVESKYIIALWAIESRFGRIMGKYPTVDALVTLAYEGRRAKFFEKELTILLKLIDQGKIKTNKTIKGSWAGALGNFQFMPSSYAMYGVDHNNTGDINLWTNLDDAFASAANYLSSNKWQYKKPCIERVKVTSDMNLTKLINDKKSFTLAKWQKLGVKSRWLKKYKDSTARLISLDKKNNVFLVYNNFEVVRKWNKSNHFAAAVCLFANSFKPKQLKKIKKQ
ncbi:MAG: lytic murein transglycosylase [Rickettsiales bacterium]|nr:lytic murein transglycosylase [Rickettsiales bacterium]